ncbi:hypothetical protein [Scale drop disease virus]|uniref:ORF_021L n=1 Tax=Scale drop disease virus TaxID=1697349 RepID=A0A0K1L646_9VIRU|nr:ORF_021L [Scale drop disease virus]AKU37436.1 ORF_021L [Scale drop disease virus]QLI60693.1 hypothetical protein [Scale drop disease virus]QXJ13611.1 ORF021L [Scale drop disease virus]UNH60762.1 hypothetical protein SDDV_ORF093 [Scale drop disease virus]
MLMYITGSDKISHIDMPPVIHNKTTTLTFKMFIIDSGPVSTAQERYITITIKDCPIDNGVRICNKQPCTFIGLNKTPRVYDNVSDDHCVNVYGMPKIITVEFGPYNVVKSWTHETRWTMCLESNA